MQQIIKRLAPAMLVLCIGLAACNVAHWKLSGETLDAVGQQFLATGKMFDTLIVEGKITPAEYRAWAVFAEKFKLIYEPPVKSWLAAKTAAEKGDAADAVLAVKNELLAFYLSALAKKGGT